MGKATGNAKRYFSSKGERRLVQQIKAVFPQHRWSSGGRFKIAEGVFKSLDLYCRDLRLIVEYDGAYHWFNIHGNLASVQQKDRLLEAWCQETDWRLIRVNEATYQQYPEVVSEIQRLISEADNLPAVTYLYWIQQTT
jgi:very-short-patch-repair endonuclease